MYLIEAESYARNGQEGEARQALEEFQRHRIRNYQGYKGADLLQEIMNERRREFCLEYDMRWCDLIRIQKGWSRNSYQNPEEAVYTLEDNDFLSVSLSLCWKKCRKIIRSNKIPDGICCNPKMMNKMKIIGYILLIVLLFSCEKSEYETWLYEPGIEPSIRWLFIPIVPF